MQARDCYRSDGPADKLAIAPTLGGQLTSGDDPAESLAEFAEALLRSGSPAEARAVIASLLATLPPDAPSRGSAAEVYADTLEALGRGPQAADLRTPEWLNGR